MVVEYKMSFIGGSTREEYVANNGLNSDDEHHHIFPGEELWVGSRTAALVGDGCDICFLIQEEQYLYPSAEGKILYLYPGIMRPEGDDSQDNIYMGEHLSWDGDTVTIVRKEI
jgi:hypothetical protein